MAKRGVKRAKTRGATQLARARIVAAGLIQDGARSVEISFETSRNRGWVVSIIRGRDVGSYDYTQARYVEGPAARERYTRRYLQKRTGTFYR